MPSEMRRVSGPGAQTLCVENTSEPGMPDGVERGSDIRSQRESGAQAPAKLAASTKTFCASTIATLPGAPGVGCAPSATLRSEW